MCADVCMQYAEIYVCVCVYMCVVKRRAKESWYAPKATHVNEYAC
jgi:hypothetical protein